MDIRILPLGPIETNAFLLLADAEALLIDAPMGAYRAVHRILDESQTVLRALLLTHGHWDHTTDAWKFAADGVPCYGHKADEALFSKPVSMSSFMPAGIPMEAVSIEHWVEGGDVYTLAGKSFEVRHVPGHAPGNVAFYFSSEAAVFGGDALFAGSIGRYDLPGGDFATLEQSIQSQLYTLPDETEVYPGHGPVTTIGVEKRRNPFVRG